MLIWCVRFLLKVVLFFNAKHLHFALVCAKDIVPDFFFICSDAIKQPCCHVLFRERRLSSDNPSKQAIYVQCFSNSLQRTLSFNILTVELESFLTNIIQ